MAHVVLKEPWGTIDLDTAKRHVWVRQTWEYAWQAIEKQASWTADEKLAFHHAVDRAVWGHWSHRGRIQARSAGHMPHPATDQHKWQVAGFVLTLSFDVKMVHSGGNWKTTAFKVDPLVKPRHRAEVDFDKRTVKLFSTDLLVHRAARLIPGDPWHEGFNVHAHEFGHTLQVRDEYDPKTSRFIDDIDSMMNVGRHIRPRHLGLICKTLRKMIPGCAFVALGP